MTGKQFAPSPSRESGHRQSPCRTSQTVWCPENLEVARLRIAGRVTEGVLVLGHFVYEQLAADARYRDTGRVPLKTVYLRQVIGRHYLDQVRDVAKRLGYVARDRSYRAGYKSQEYWILEPYDSAQLVRREIHDVAICRDLRAWREQRQKEIWDRIRRNDTPVACEVVEHLWRHLQRVQFVGVVDLGSKFHPADQVAIDHLRRGDFRIAVDDYGRIHTNLTNLKSELRGNLAVDNQTMVNVDIGESQPLFIGLVMAKVGTGQEENWRRRQEEEEQEGTKQDHHMLASTMLDKPARPDWHLDRNRLPDDVNSYLTLCESRALYQTVADALGTTRDQAKRKVLAAFFDIPSHRNRVHDILDGLFPSIMAAMARLKRDDYRRLAHFAQGVESRFMFGRVIPLVMKERPDLFVSTIHDSVLTTAGNGEYVRQVMLDEFGRLGVSPFVRVEPC